jgi:hypothetical protein
MKIALLVATSSQAERDAAQVQAATICGIKSRKKAAIRGMERC